MILTSDIQNITKGSLGHLESDFLSRIGPLGLFTLKDAGRILGPDREKYARQFLARLRMSRLSNQRLVGVGHP